MRTRYELENALNELYKIDTQGLTENDAESLFIAIRQLERLLE